MPPTGSFEVKMDEDAMIEAEIAFELENINLDADDFQDPDNADQNIQQDADGDLIDGDVLPNEMLDYIKHIQNQTKTFEDELAECDDLLCHTDSVLQNPSITVADDDNKMLEELAQNMGESPESYKRRILEELDNDDTDMFDVPLMPGDLAGEEENEDGSKALVLVDERQLEFQKMFREQMVMMEERQKEKEKKMKELIDQEKHEQEIVDNEREEKWKLKLEELEREKTLVIKERQVQQQKAEEDMKHREKEIEVELKYYEEEMQKMEEETKQEQLRFTEAKLEEEQKHENKKQVAATKIQSVFKGYCVRKEYENVLKEKELERKKRWEEERIIQVEKEIKERKAEEERQKTEEEEKKEMLKKKEEERLQKEKEEKERKEADEKRKAEEKQKRIEEEKRKLEEKKRKEEEEKKRKIEEKERKKEEERKEKQRQEEERLRKKAEEERLKKEAEEKQQKEAEEKLRKEAEEKKQREEEKKRKIEEEENHRKAEEEKLTQEKLREEKKKAEQEKLKNLTEDMIPEEERGDDEEQGIGEIKKNGVKENVKSASKHVRIDENSDNSTAVAKDETFVKTDEIQNKKQVSNSTEKTFVVEKTVSQKIGAETKKGMVREDMYDSVDEFGDGSEQKRDAATKMLMEGLPDNLEQKRLQWIKECLPWSKVSNEPWKLKNSTSKRTVRRPSSAKKLQPLAENIIISAARVATLRQVTTVELHDLPGSNLTTFGQCWGLKCLTMNNCNLTVIEGLQQCKQLQYLDLKENKIEYLDLKDLGNLTFLHLSKNNLSMIHGLNGCTNLRWLDLSNNKITRLGGLETLRRLHTLILSHNQLINTLGLGEVPTLQVLNLSNNHLQNIQELDKLCILQHLDVSSNNLLKLPSLHNHVLLQDLLLEDNSITSLKDLKSYWLPLLQTLHIAQNSIDELVSLENLQLLRNFDISNNQILDVNQLKDAICKCINLDTIRVDGNPAVEATEIKFDGLPRLVSVDDVIVEPSLTDGAILKPRNSFEAMCLTQAQLSKDISQKLDQEIQALKNSSLLDILLISEAYFKFCNKSHKVAVEHRYAHEYGEITMAMPMAPSTPKSSTRPRSARSTRLLQREEQYSNPKEMFEKAVHGVEKDDSSFGKKGVKNGLGSEKTVVVSAKAVKNLMDNDLNENSSSTIRDQAATKIQAVWRGHYVRKLIKIHTQDQHSADDLLILKELHGAATKIQAVWRGYFLRVRLERALEFARIDDDDEFDFEEVDMGEFNFDENVLDDWKPPETPQIPSNHPVLGKPPSGKLGSPPKIPSLNLGDKVQPPSNPRRAWRGMDSPLSDVQQNGHMPHPPSSRVSADTQRTVMSKKEEKLSEEWGFKDTNTAHLMMQRAKKMKYNSERRKKLSKLDPKQRLALFRRLEDTNVVRKPVYNQSNKTLPRKEYFQARQEEIDRQDLEKRLMQNMRNSRTYEWLHTQVGDFNVTDSRINQTNARSGSEGNLPKLDPDVAAGRPVRLVASPSMDLQSVDSASQQGDFVRGRRYSAGSEASSFGKFPPIKSNSAGSSNSRKKEKMSWRRPEINKSVGWGGGKKRGRTEF